LKKLIEAVFRRQELADLKKEVETKNGLIKLLTSGYTIHLTQYETQMILWAIEFKPLRELIELPKTKAAVRIIWRDLREKIKQHLKEVYKEDQKTEKDDETTLEAPTEILGTEGKEEK